MDMIPRITRLLLIFFITALSIYFVTINQAHVSVAVSDHNAFSGSIGVVVLLSFALGIFFTMAGAAFWALKGYIREQSLLRRQKTKLLLEESVLQARAFRSANELKRSKLFLEKLIIKHPDEIFPRLELVTTLSMLNDPTQALKALDEARRVFPENNEILFRAAEIYEAQGNVTASLDNLILLIEKFPSAEALKKARELSIKLERYEIALDFNERLKGVEGSSPAIKQAQGTILAHMLVRDLKNKPELLSESLVKHILNYESCALALKELSKLRMADGQPDLAAQCLQKAFRVEKDPELLREARNIWCAHGFKDKAISGVKTWVRECTVPEECLEARLELAKTYLLVGQDTDASYEIELLEKEPYANQRDAKREIAIIKAIIAYRSRDTLRSIDAFREVELLELQSTTNLLI